MKTAIYQTVSALALAAAPCAAWAQQAADARAGESAAPPEIIVTAERRTANIMDVPLAVTAVSGDRLQEGGARDIRDLQQFVPNIQFNPVSAASAATIFIRGVGISDFNANNTGAVGVYVDDVFLAASAGKLFSMFDPASIEVLRGPQGTLYGRNTTGGAIRFTSKQPTDEFSGNATLSYGNLNDVRIDAGIGGPIVDDKLKFRVAGFRETRDGYLTNLVTGKKLNDIDNWAARLILEFTPTSETSIKLAVHGGQNLGGARQFVFRGQLPGNTDLSGYTPATNDIDTQSYNVEGLERIDNYGTSLRIEHDLGWGSATSISAYEAVKRRTEGDYDNSPADILTGFYRENPRQFSQELRLQSNSERKLRWIVGGYFLSDRLKTNSNLDLLGLFRDPTAPYNGAIPSAFIGNLNFPYTQKTKAFAAFGQVDYGVTDALTATVGLRYSRDKIDMNYRSFYLEPEGPIPGTELVFIDSRSFDDLSYRFALNYKIDKDNLVYASYSTGYNAGGFPGGSATSLAELKPYDSEKLYALEAGYKGSLLDRRLRLALTGFYYDYKNIQVYILDDTGVLPVQRKGNAKGAEIYGFEAELTARPVRSLELSLAGGYTHSQYRTFVVPPNDYTGNRLTNSPKFTVSGSVQYTHDVGSAGKIIGRVEGFAQSAVFFQPANQKLYGESGYYQLNAQLIYRPAPTGVEFSLWAKNFTNRRYVTAIYPIVTSDAVGYNDPRTYGIRFGYRF